MQAVILAAGMGKRLKNLTKNNTKCMVSVNGVTLIDRMLHQIERRDIDKIVIVVGYEAQKLKDYIGTLSISIPIEYVDNPIYDKTNNIYSLFLAEKYLVEDDTLLLESDLIFEDSVVDLLLSDERDTLALVDKYESWMDGTCVILSDDDTIVKFVPGNKFEYSDADKYYKTVNIYKFGKEFSEKIYVPFLRAYLSALGENEYYEQVLKVLTLLDDPQIFAKRLNGEKWYEIDDVQDLDIAESIFAETNDEHVKKILNRYGGYWRYPNIIDYCYPQNHFFPNERCLDEIKASSERLIKNYPSGQSVIRLLGSKDTNIDEKHVLITNGIEESIHVVLNAIPGSIGVVAPANEIVKDTLQERVAVFSSQIEETPSAASIIDYYEHSSISALVVSNPNCHTGYAYKFDDVMDIVKWADKKGIYLIVDETYIDFSDCSTSLMKEEYLAKYSRMIILKNISVAYGIPGLRLGFSAIADVALLEKCQNLLPCWNVDSFAEFFLQIIGKYQKPFRYSVAKSISERDYFEQELGVIDDIRVVKGKACFVLFELLNGLSAYHVCSTLLSDYNILVKDVSQRISDQKKQYIKASIRSHEENVLFVEALKNVINIKTRVCRENIDIDDTRMFFEQRTQKSLPHRYNYVIYQDSNPELAVERDAYEKNKISPFLNTKESSIVLDVGCGVARWGDYFSEMLISGKYVGIDFSENLLDIARNQYSDDSRYIFVRGAFQDLEKILFENKLPDKFDIVLINGVLMYINDHDIYSCLEGAGRKLISGGIIYIKESVGVDDRFTLNHFFSKEMNADYSAIYRSIKQYDAVLNETFRNEFEIVTSGYTWDEVLSNRKETASYYWIIRKK